MTAENASSRRRTSGSRRRFNEAAADDRGKQRQRLVRGPIKRPASMRPRPMTAENFQRRPRRSSASGALQ